MERRPASLEVCAQQCGAKCCKEPGFINVTPAEMKALKALATARKVKVRFRGGLGPFAKQFIIEFDKHGGQCPFLGAENECTIHLDRPGCCQRFPNQPTMGCLVWPGTNPKWRAEAR